MQQGGFPPERSTNGLAVTSMVLGILGACGIACYGAGGLLGILAIIFGAVARSQIAHSQGAQSGKGMATAGLVLGCIVVGLGVITMLSCIGLMAAGGAAGAAGTP
jgi:hypothetical protein